MTLHYRDSLAMSVAKTRLSFAPPCPLCYIFCGSNDLARKWFVRYFHARAGIPGPQKTYPKPKPKG
jgi:hypothetical protein